MKLPNKTLERNLFKSGYGYVCAVDEVGMGCLAGPVVVCAVGITNHFYNRHHKKLRYLRDSKLLNTKQREKYAAELIADKDLVYSVASATPAVIDRLNIYGASRDAMKRALKKISTEAVKSIVLVDGNKKIKGIKTEQLAVVKGDRKVFAIACASVIAKVYRDNLMDRQAGKYPQYGFEKHKGYGTRQHIAALKTHGPCPLHRRSFRLEY